MRLKTLSATSAKCYETCPARFQAEFLNYAKNIQNSAGGLGTDVHNTLQRWVEDGWYQKNLPRMEARKVMADLFDQSSPDPRRASEGLEMCFTWLERQDWTDRVVVSTETKENFKIPTSIGEIPFNYIFDRLDLIEGPTQAVEVIDYKTWAHPIQPADLAQNLQARAYALGAQIKYPDLDGIWVTFDQLRFDPVGVFFTKDDSARFWRYLKNLAAKIIDDEKPRENLNMDCRFCVRKGRCTALEAHMKAGGVLATTDPLEAAQRLNTLQSVKGAVESQISELDAFLKSCLEAANAAELELEGGVKVSLSSQGRRSIDPRMAARVLPPEIVNEYAKFDMKTVDALLKDDRLTDDQKKQLSGLVRKNWTEPKVKVSAGSV